MALPIPDNLSGVFAPFDSGDLEVLDSFAGNVEELQESRFGRNLEKLGQRPVVTQMQRRPGGGGSGLVRVRHASPESRASVFAVARRLKLEHEYGSFHQACGVLKSSTKRNGSTAATNLRNRIEAARRRIRSVAQEPASVGIVVTEGSSQRSYSTRDEISELAEYGHHFHQGDEELRGDWNALPKPLLEPSIDEALRATAEAALSIAPLVKAVLTDPILRLR